MTCVLHMVGNKSYETRGLLCEGFRGSPLRGMLEHPFQRTTIVSCTFQQKQHSPWWAAVGSGGSIHCIWNY